MYNITFHCKVLSPMFLGGADDNLVELRPPSIKGALRFWWRAMNSHLPVDTDQVDEDGNVIIQSLKSKEAELFGDTGRKSSILITCKMEKEKIETKKFRGSQLYMAYGAENRAFFDVGTEFSIQFSSKIEKHFIEIKKAFSLLSHLGGLGAKSRNGYGAFSCENADSFEEILEYDCFSNLSKDAFYTSIGDETEIYKSILPQKNWEAAIDKLKIIYADNAKRRIKPKSQRVYIAAPYISDGITFSPPQRHPKIHVMSLTEIENELFYTITFLPYNYLVDYPDLDVSEVDKHFNNWDFVVFGDKDEDCYGFNDDIFNAKNRNGDYFVEKTINSGE